MAIKVKKLVIPAQSEIENMTHEELISLVKEWSVRLDQYQGMLFKLRKKIFGRSSERSKDPIDVKPPESATSSDPLPVPANTDKPKKPRIKTPKKLSERYPLAPVHENVIPFNEAVCCPGCGCTMTDSGMTEDSEYLTAEPKEFIIIRQKRQKLRCKCHGAILTAPAPARITPGGSYSDEIIVDAALSKFCDLIPMERYSQMAARLGHHGLPPHSLITATLRLSQFLLPVYQRVRSCSLNSPVLSADETPHKMLEGHAKNGWYLWGFSSNRSCFFECHSTRSGDVSTAILLESACEFLVSDAYSGYSKSIGLANEERSKRGLNGIAMVGCNAHARRYFRGNSESADDLSNDAKFIVDRYKKIYKLEADVKGKSKEEILEARAKMKPIFDAMKIECQLKLNTYSTKSQMYTAYNYFLGNYENLTRFLDNHILPIDNNHSERLLRNHVVGRKTWYGTHSPKAAIAAAIHFSLVESCKLNFVNPRSFYLDAVDRLLNKKDVITPFEYKQMLEANTC
jgi:transposase